MQPQLIQAINGLPDKAVVYAFEGTVKKTFQRSAGTNTNGDWSIESAIVADAAGDEIKVMVKDRAPMGFQVGQFLNFEAHKGDKGYSGLYAEDDEYKGNVRRILRATPTCHINFAGSGQSRQQDAHAQPPRQQQQAAPPQRAQAQPQQRTQQATPQGNGTTAAQREAHDSVNEARRTIMQIANLHLLCAVAVDKYEAPEFKRRTSSELSESQRQGAIASIFIESCKCGLVRNMPTNQLPE